MDFIKETIKLAKQNVAKGGRPFACIVVQKGKIISKAVNRVAQTNDPTAHAEINAIRKATKLLGREHLEDCEIFILAEPCPMCLGSLYYCSPKKVTFIVTRDDYFPYYKDDRKYFAFKNFYKEYAKPWNKRKLPMNHKKHPDGVLVYKEWKLRNTTKKNKMKK